jgi:hypothetical protein
LVFPNRVNETFDVPMPNRFMREMLKARAKPHGFTTPHGFRTTLRDRMRAETKFKEVHWKAQVDHTLGSGDAADEAYGHDRLLDQRREMMEMFGEWGSYTAAL